MKKKLWQFFAVMGFAFVAFSGCATNTGDTHIYLNDQQGGPVASAYINAYADYEFSSDSADKWGSMGGTIVSHVKTDSSGYANIELPAGKYAFQASIYNENAGQTFYSGMEQEIRPGTNSINITIQLPAAE